MEDNEDYSIYMKKAGPGYIDPYRLFKYERKIYGETPPKQNKQESLNPVSIRRSYRDAKIQFKTENQQIIASSQQILKYASNNKTPKLFYPLTLGNKNLHAQIVDLKNQNKVQIQSNKNEQQYVDLNMKIGFRNGKNAFEVKQQIFNQFMFEPSSIQFEINSNQFPENLFFCFDSALSKQDVIKNIASEGDDDVPSRNNPKVKVEREVKKMNFLELVHTVLGKEFLPNYSFPVVDKIGKIDDELVTYWQKQNTTVTLQFVTCEDVFQQAPPNLYISDISVLQKQKLKLLALAKKYELNCQTKQILLDIRGILQSQKIYFIQMMQQSKSAVKLAQTAETRITDISVDIIKQIYEILVNKSKQFLLLACTCIQSSIQIDVRVKNLFEYLTSNFMYSQTLSEPSAEILQTSHVLDSWYNIPQQKNIHGYTIRQVKQQIYQLIRKSCIMKKRIQYNAQYKQIKKIIDSNERKPGEGSAASKKKIIEKTEKKRNTK